uniref:Uncharacterized protein n=1 Tax=Brassica juncea TaxID=3707 RepID=A0A385FBQ4_BRAJU|nr:hypothetical protein [Brassica juncea]AXU98970.1 hypothetical protein [Brassica juncea]AXU99032.1 hypothetical protein [Brassica juncea]
MIVRIGSQVLYCTPVIGFFSPFPHGTCTLSVIEEYLGLEGGPPFSRKSDQNSNTPRFTGKDRTIGTNLQGYHLLWPDLPTFSQLQFTAPFRNLKEEVRSNSTERRGACWFFHHPIHKKSNETWRKRSEHFGTKLRLSFSSNPKSALARRY